MNYFRSDVVDFLFSNWSSHGQGASLEPVWENCHENWKEIVRLIYQGGETCGLICLYLYLDMTEKKSFHYFLNTQQIFMR